MEVGKKGDKGYNVLENKKKKTTKTATGNTISTYSLEYDNETA